MRTMLPSLLLAACARDVGPGADTDITDTQVEGGDPTPGYTRIVVLADPHVIGDDYVCCESPGLDTDSIYKTRRRLETATDLIAAVEPPVERGFVLGDLFHQNYKFEKLEDYTDPDKGSAAYRSWELFDRFEFPMEYLWGNHDYEVPEFPREFSHEIFRTIFQTEPYHAVDVGNFRFLLMNSQLGRTWDADPLNAFLSTGEGSFGREQLAWADEQLSAGKTTFLMFHHPPLVIERDEDPDGPIADVWALIEAHPQNVAGVFVGHTHRWLDLSPLLNDVPTTVVGSVRYDADNFWVFDLPDDGDSADDVTVVDKEKAAWTTPYAFGTLYTEDGVTIDPTVPAEEDPAGPWDNWETPPPWPPSGD